MKFASRMVLLVAVSVSVMAGVRAQSRSPQDDAVANVKALTSRLRLGQSDLADQRRYEEMADITAQLQKEIDRYVGGAIASTANSEAAQGRLRDILSEHRPHSDYGDDAFVRTADLSGGKSMLVAYTIVRPPHHDIATIRGYRTGREGFELVATTGDDFEGYGMFKRLLPSPFPQEL